MIYKINSRITLDTPLFMPVYEIGNKFIDTDILAADYDCKALITNAYFLYKDKENRKLVSPDYIKKLLNFNGTVATDSGAFQAYSYKIIINNRKIIKYQQDIGADLISPLDVVSMPGEKRKIITDKMNATLKRIEQGMRIADSSVLIGVQQGGKYLDLRKQCTLELVKLNSRYIAIGSLVPFFTKNHKLDLVFSIINQSRALIPKTVPIHLYGAGDPLELPFYCYFGCDIFDSSSFIHYARKGFYMTPYGAVNDISTLNTIPFKCECNVCRQFDDKRLLLADEISLSRHNLYIIYNVVKTIRENLAGNTLYDYCQETAEINKSIDPTSSLHESWKKVVETRELS